MTVGVQEKRESWSGRLAYLCASVGSAVGIGSISSFSAAAARYGGAAFLIPYLLAVALIALPILTLEMASGQVFRGGDIAAFSAINRRFSGIGVASVFCSFVKLTYSVVIMAWAAVMVAKSFGKHDFLDFGPLFFLKEVVHMKPMLLPDGSLNRSAAIVTPTLVAASGVWLVLYICVVRGPRVMGRITFGTVLLPCLCVLFLAVFFGVQDGSQGNVWQPGLDDYVRGDVSQISAGGMCGNRSCVEAWPDAVAQAFFTLSVGFGVMTAYSSYNPRSQGVQVNALVVGMFDVVVSVVSGVMVFGALGVAGEHHPKHDLTTIENSIFLVFSQLPLVFGSMERSDGTARVTAVVFYLAVLSLGVDSALALLEGCTTALKDSRVMQGMSRCSLTAAICVIGWLVTVELCVDTGIFSITSLDFYNNITMFFVGLLECIAAGWFYKYSETVEKVGLGAFWTLFATMFLSMYVGTRVGLGVGGYERYADVGTGVGFLSAAFVMAAGSLRAGWLARAHKGGAAPAREVFHDLFLWNVEELRSTFNTSAGGAAGNLSIPAPWSLLIKFVAPPVLMLMLMLKFVSPSFGNYGGYHQWYQGWAIGVEAVAWLAVALGFLCPGLLGCLLPAAAHSACESQRPTVAGQLSHPVPAERVGAGQ